MQDDELIESLGGITAVARQLGVEPNRVNNWRRRGVPADQHIALWRMALAAGLDWEPPGAAELRPLLAAQMCPPAETQPPREAA